MPHLRLVTDAESPSVPNNDRVPTDDRPMVSLRLLMAASGRCSCDDCLWAYRRGDKRAGIVESSSARALTAVR